jgi:Trypsin-like peptidase domain
MRCWAAGTIAAVVTVAFSSIAEPQSSSFFQIERSALASVVYVEADRCSDGQARGGSGFVFERQGLIVTAHHVVGGCSSISVTFPASGQGRRRFPASISRILSSGDLAALEVADAPRTPILTGASPPPDRAAAHAGLGFEYGELSAEALPITFSPSEDTRLDRWLPAEAQRELARSESLIDIGRNVLRFNSPLEPGMSGGPIIDQSGKVVGVVAGGLKAGTVPASWGWPAEWLSDLLRSREATTIPVSTVETFFTLRDLTIASEATQASRTIRCGDLEFTYRGTRRYPALWRGSDDQRRLNVILQAAPYDNYDNLSFDVWTNPASGATALLPAGYPITYENGVCVVRSGQLQQVVWARSAQPQEIQAAAITFESQVMIPRIPPTYGWQWDNVLTKFAFDNFGQPIFQMGPQSETRSDGLVFTRKGFIHFKTALGMAGPKANSFETLASRNGTFMGVGTINGDVPPQLGPCGAARWVGPGCGQAHDLFLSWTLFILCTQLSSYPVI